MLSRIPATAAIVALLLASATARAQFPGALFTTDANALVPPGSLYATAADVHLYFGPGDSCAGLEPAPGYYYFQVTDPSGLVLLSTDSLEDRRIRVNFGVITTSYGAHVIRNGPCPDSKIVSLLPFLATPNPLGEYKLWITPVEAYDVKLNGFHGFIATESRTHNFRIVVPGVPPVLQTNFSGHVFYDLNEDGAWQPRNGEVPLAGWRVEIWKNGAPDDITFVDETGRYEFLRDRDGATYEIREIAPPPGYAPATGAPWISTTPRQATVVANAATVPGPDFGNLAFELAPGVGRSKGFWHNEGRSLLEARDDDWRLALNAACLRKPISTANPALSIYTVPPLPTKFRSAFLSMSNWIVGQGAQGHAGYLLSNQVAATILNNTCGFMQGTVYIDRFQNNQLVSLAEMLNGAIGLLCSPGAGLTRPNDPPQPSPIPGVDLRTAMLMCLNEFDTINNTGNLTEAQVVYSPKTSPFSFSSPY